MLIGIYMQLTFFFVIFFKIVWISHVSSFFFRVLNLPARIVPDDRKIKNPMELHKKTGRPEKNGWKYCLTKGSVLGRIIRIRRNKRAAADQKQAEKQLITVSPKHIRTFLGVSLPKIYYPPMLFAYNEADFLMI